MLVSEICRSAEEADPLEERLVEIKRHFEFSEWRGTVKVPDRRIARITIEAADLAQYGEIRISTPVEQREDELTFNILGDENTSGVSVDISLHEDALEAQEWLVRGFQAVSAPLELYEKATEGGPMDIGDVCIFAKESTPPPGTVQVNGRPYCAVIMFTRNNVLVTIRNNPEEGKAYADIIELARYIDQKLVDSLE